MDDCKHFWGSSVHTVSKTIVEVCTAINTHLGTKYLHLPNDVDEMRRKVSEFELKFGMTQAFGCIDGTHVPLKRPQNNSQDYFNYKQFFPLMSRLPVIAKDILWMWSVNGLGRFTMLKFFQILH